MTFASILFALVAALPIAALACPHDQAQKHAFVKQHPCPSTGKNHGACPGWIVDHIVAMCRNGKDRPGNMQWQTVEDAKIKDRCECAPRGCPLPQPKP